MIERSCQRELVCGGAVSCVYGSDPRSTTTLQSRTASTGSWERWRCSWRGCNRAKTGEPDSWRRKAMGHNAPPAGLRERWGHYLGRRQYNATICRNGAAWRRVKGALTIRARCTCRQRTLRVPEAPKTAHRARSGWRWTGPAWRSCCSRSRSATHRRVCTNPVLLYRHVHGHHSRSAGVLAESRLRVH